MQLPARHKIYEAETNPLSSSNKLYGEAHGIYGVLKKYLDRGDDNNWTGAVPGINIIPDYVQNTNTEYKNLATHYGDISIDKIRAFDNTYIYNPMILDQDRHTM